MREIDASLITEKVKHLVMDAEYFIPQDFISAIEKMRLNKIKAVKAKKLLYSI